jgi:putative spermidine/putrescine transport system substrate-binding protein
VVVNGYAAEYEDLFNKLIKAPFEQETGIKVVFDSTGSAAEDYAKIRASGGDPGWDVDVVTAQEAIQGAKENLLLEISEANVPSMKLLYPDMRKLVGPYGVPHEIQYMSLMYNKEKVQPAPDSWQIMWDPKLKGHVIDFQFANILGVYHMIMAAKINGGSIENVEPGFQALERMKDNLLDWPLQSTQAVVNMERGEVWVMPYWDGRAHYYVNQGLPYDFVIPKEGSIPLVNSLIIPKGAKNRDNAIAWLKVCGSLAGQDGFNPLKGSIPVRTDGGKTAAYDDYQRWAINEFANDTIVPSVVHGFAAKESWVTDFDNAINVFASNRDVGAAAQALQQAAQDAGVA